GIRVPCIIRWPGKIKADTETDEVTWALDLFPTICHFANVNTDGLTLDGKDLSGLLTSQTPVGTRELYWQLGPHAELKRGRWSALRQGNWKYIEDANGEEFLFDLNTDPNEKQNLIQTQAAKRKELQQRRDLLVKTLTPQVKTTDP
ncbi:MAG: hypothetical protein KDA74_08630, partial [Planctomycetaceae bacterium]|nr:hypothetical protein [Planctomycetaceae bacterium]